MGKLNVVGRSLANSTGTVSRWGSLSLDVEIDLCVDNVNSDASKRLDSDAAPEKQ